jgi:hypothetical protein
VLGEGEAEKQHVHSRGSTLRKNKNKKQTNINEEKNASAGMMLLILKITICVHYRREIYVNDKSLHSISIVHHYHCHCGFLPHLNSFVGVGKNASVNDVRNVPTTKLITFTRGGH